MIHRFTLESRLTPEQCRAALAPALAGKEEPCGSLRGSWFRVRKAEYFHDNYTVVRYSVFGHIRAGENGGSRISCTCFQGAADPLVWGPLFLLVTVGLSLLPPKDILERLPLNAKCGLIAAVGVIAANWLATFAVRKQTGQQLPSTIGEFLCKVLDAREAGR